MLIISFDAVGDSEYDRLMEYPAFSAFTRQAAVFRGVPTLFSSNTYPIHASIVTGVMPNIHGVKSNTQPFPARRPAWNSREDGIRVRTLWQAAAANGIDTATVFWPVTAFSKTIRYNIPEVLPPPGKNQALACLKAGSKLLQLKMLMRHAKLLNGIRQPNRDNYATACMADILRERKPGLALIHLTAYDSLCHKFGKDSDDIKTAIETLDRSLSVLLEAVGDDRDVIVFSDHSQINVHTALDPNSILVNAGLLGLEEDVYIPGVSGCYFECCGGAAYFHSGNLSGDKVDEIRIYVKQNVGFLRFLTQEEMHVSGYENVAFGFCAQRGYCFSALSEGNKAEHGYPPDTPDYSVFYVARGYGFEPGKTTNGGSLLDIAPLAARSLGFTL